MAGAQKWEDLHQMLLSADSNESPMPYSGELAVINPYRIIAKSGELFSVTVSIPNQSSDPILAQGCLCLPPNWIAEPGQVTIPAHSIGQMEFLVSVPKGTKVRRQAITVELNLNGQPYGEVAEAIVSVDSPQF